MASKHARTPGQEGPENGASAGQGGYQPAYTPGSQSRRANEAFSRQAATAGKYSRDNYVYAARRKRGRGKKIAIGVIVAVLVVVIGAGTAAGLYLKGINDQLNRGDKSDSEISAIDKVLTGFKNKAFNQPFYVMLIGTDETEDSQEETHRSDTNIVVRVDPTKNQATMVSIPRDTKIDITGHGTNKFNAAYAFDGAAGAIREANELLGVDISHYAEVNFGKLKELVDAVGGVDVEVPEMVDDPDADGTSAHPEWPRVIIEPGLQHLDGNQALVFARSRNYVDGDFTRTANQRTLIKAIVDKVLALPVTELPGVIQAAAQCVTTDLTVTDIVSLAQQFKDGDDLAIFSAMVPSTTATIDGVSYVINDAASTKEMMKVVEEGGDPSGITVSAEAMAAATNGTLDSGSTNSSSTGSGYDSGSYGYDSGYGYSNGYDPNYGYSGSSGYSSGSTGYDSSLYYDAGSTGTSTGGTGTGTGTNAGTSAGSGTGYDPNYGTGTGTGYDAGTGASGSTGYGY